MKADEKIEKNYFAKIFVGVLILHIIFLYILPGFSKIVIKKPDISKISIGIVNREIETSPKKHVEEEKKNEKPEIKKEKKVVEKKVEKKEAPKVVEKAKPVTPPKKPKKILTTTQSIDDLDVLAAVEAPRTIPKEGIKDKPDIIKVEDKVSVVDSKDININQVDNDSITEPKDVELGNVEVKNIDSTPNLLTVGPKDESIDDIQWEDITSDTASDIIGPKTGLRVGAIDGKSKVVWDPSNKDPKYPVEAEKRAQTADVKLVLDVDSTGKVIHIKITKTGVDVIDREVEKVARTWNIKLINNGMAVDGSVMVIYQFKLKGRE